MWLNYKNQIKSKPKSKAKDKKPLEPSSTVEGIENVATALGEIWQFLKRLYIELPRDWAIPFWGMDPREMKMYNHTKTCT